MKQATIAVLVCGTAVLVIWLLHLRAPGELPTRDANGASRSAEADGLVPLEAMPHPVFRESIRSTGVGQLNSVIIPPALAKLLGEPWRPVSWNQAASFEPLSPAVEMDLIERCRGDLNPTNVAGLFTVLAYHGSNAAFDFLADTLTNRFRGKRLVSKEESVLLHLPIEVGLLARWNDQAFDFLCQGLKTDFWREHLVWLSDDRGNAIATLVAMTLRGVGTSGRTEAAGVLNEQRKLDSVVMHLGLQGALIDAAFWLRLALDEEEQFYRGESLETGEQMMRRFSAWRAQTAEGQEWSRWASARKQVAH